MPTNYNVTFNDISTTSTLTGGFGWATGHVDYIGDFVVCAAADQNEIRVWAFNINTLPAGDNAIMASYHFSESYTTTDVLLKLISTTSLYLFYCGSSFVGLNRVNPSALTGTSAQAEFVADSGCTNPVFYENGAASYLAASNNGAGTVSFYVFDPATVTGTIAPTATLTAESQPLDTVIYSISSTLLWVLCANKGSNTVSLFAFDPATVSGTVAATATFNTTNSPKQIILDYVSSTEAFLVVACETNANSFFRFNPSSLSGVYAEAASFSTLFSGGRIDYCRAGYESYLVSSSFSGQVPFHRFDPRTVSGSLIEPTARLLLKTSDSRAVGVRFIYNGATTAILVNAWSPYGAYYFKLNPATVSSNVNASAFYQVGDSQPQTFYFQNNGANSALYLVLAQNRQFGVFKTDLNARNITVKLPADYLLNASTPIRKLSGGALTIYTVLDYFIAALILRAGAQISTSGFGNAVLDYAFIATTDTSGTINEDFVFSDTAGIVGNYRITMGVGTTLTLGSKGTYNDALTVPATGTLALTAGTTIGDEFILSAGTTITAIGGSRTLTIPYADPGLVLGAGVTLSAPVASITVSGIPNGANAILGVIDLTTMETTFPTIISGSATIVSNPAHTYFLACDARGYLRQTATLAGNIPSYTFNLTNFRTLYEAGVSRAADIVLNTSTFEVMIGDGTPKLSLADVFRTIEDELATPEAIFFSTPPYPVIVSTGSGAARQYLFFPYDTVAGTPNPVRIKPKTTNTSDPTLTDFVVVHEGSSAPLFSIFDFTGAGGRTIRFQTEAVAASVIVSGNGALTTEQAAQLAALNATLASSGVFSNTALANTKTAIGLTAANLDTQLNGINANIDQIPTNDYSSNISAIKTQTDKFVFTTTGRVDATAIGVPTNPLLTNDSRLNNLDAAISTRTTAADVQVTVSGGFGSSDRNALNALPTLAQIEASTVLFKASGYTAPANSAILNAIDALPLLGEIEASTVLFKASDYTAPANSTISAIGTRTARIDALITNPGSGDRFTTTALSNAPTSSGASITVDDIWTGFTSGTVASNVVSQLQGFASGDRATLQAIPISTYASALNTLQASVNAIPTVVYTSTLSAILGAVQAIPTTPLLTNDSRLNAINTNAKIAKQGVTNRYKIDETVNTGTLYDDDGTTPIVVQALKDKDGNPASTQTYERVPQ